MSEFEFNFIRELVRKRAAIVIEPGKEYLVESRLTPLLQQESIASFGDLIRILRAQPLSRLHDRVVEAMTTNETLFFRDGAPFEALRTRLLPELLERRRLERRLTIWSAACSSGQEPYSVAMLLREAGALLSGWHIQLIATDLSSTVLNRARAGRYSQLEVNRGLSPLLLNRYFQQLDDNFWQLTPEIRNMVDFREINLANTWPILPEMDIVLLRNVMIYFDIETRRTILGKVRRLLRQDGYLFLGGAETTSQIDDAFKRIQLERTAVYQVTHHR